MSAVRLADTRSRLLEAAARTIHESGYASTTLGMVAKAARVPLGNVYYHFPTKRSLARAVIEARVESLEAELARAEEAGGPRERILALIEARACPVACRAVSRFGCELGSLAEELEKGDRTLGREARPLVALQLEWLGRQLRGMGAGPNARALALELVCGMQGAALVAHTLEDPRVLRDRLEALAERVRGLPVARAASRRRAAR